MENQTYKQTLHSVAENLAEPVKALSMTSSEQRHTYIVP